MEKGREGESRKIFLDVARVLAIFAVVMIHVSAGFVVGNESSTSAFIFGNIFDSLSRIGVPLFLMISGALMLSEEKEITGKSIFKRIKNIVVLLIFWSACYAIFYSVLLPFCKGREIAWKEFLYNFVMGHYHLWYLYMLIGLYLITPFLRSFVKKENKNLVMLFVAFAVLAQFLPTFLSIFCVYVEEIKHIVAFIEKFELRFFCGYTAYYLLGWYIVHVGFSKKQKICIYVASVLSIMGIISIAQWIPIKAESAWTAYDLAYSNSNLLVLLYTAGVFTVLSNLKNERVPVKLGAGLAVASKLSFGVYVVHIVVLSVMHKIFAFISVPFLSLLVLWGATTVISFLVCYVLSKIPLLKKLIRA